ncbi:MAG: beta-galactosidase [Syntrophaceae bacterium]|nr:beta-galactosidase [Syntrophaceae bacterium]
MQMSPSHHKRQIIQQAQYGKMDASGSTADTLCRAAHEIGVTSFQSYVPWSHVEPSCGQFDFSGFDEMVNSIRRHGLRWVPFLIFGPAYATPEWFHDSPDCVYACCLEHDRSCRIQSIWNPFLPPYVERFLSAFFQHYSDHDLFESVQLGVSGNWGESIFPASGGFTLDVHVHPGWWCGDSHARQSFGAYLREQYNQISRLNARYGSSFDDFSKVQFPAVAHSIFSDLFHGITRRAPGMSGLLTKAWQIYREIQALVWKRKKIPWLMRPGKNMTPEQRTRWNDFICWYQDSMTSWSERWIDFCRTLLSQTDINLVVGGVGEPCLGADISAQTRMVAKYEAGIRITSYTDDFGTSFAQAGLASGAGHVYSTYLTTEEAGMHSAAGVPARIFDAIASNSRGLYFKNLLGVGRDFCTKKYYPHGSITPIGETFRQSSALLAYCAVRPETCVLYPKSTIDLLPAMLGAWQDFAARLRRFLPFECYDERMIETGALDDFRFLILPADIWVEDGFLNSLRKWLEKGGVLMTVGLASFWRSNDFGKATIDFLHAGENGAGYVWNLPVDTRQTTEMIVEALVNSMQHFPWSGLERHVRGLKKGYYSLLTDGVVVYNASDREAQCEIWDRQRKRTIPITVSPRSVKCWISTAESAG